MEINGDHAVMIEIEPLANSMKRELDALYRLSDQYTIHRVAADLRELDEMAYTPRIISIGPIHHGKEKFSAMEEYKRRYLQDFLERTEVNLESFIKVIKEKEERIRDCYAESIKFSSDEFVKMVLIDAVFIIEVMWRNFIQDRIYAYPRQILEIKDDMFMFENQLPFFILEDLFTLATDNSNIGKTPISMLKITHKFSKLYWDYLGVEETLEENKYAGKVKHLLDFLSISISPRNSWEERKPVIRTAPSVTELHYAGVEFKWSSNKNLFELRFSNGVLEIPRMRIGISTKYILKNLLALEQSQSDTVFLNDYVRIISCFCGTPKDLKLLVENGIIENDIGDEDAVYALIQKLAGRITIDIRYSYFASLVEDLNRYYSNPWRKWKPDLMKGHYNITWITFSVITGVIVLILTIVQAVCSVLAVI